MRKINFFLPGDEIITKGFDKKAKPVMDRIRFTFPARVHITLIDSNRLDFGKPGGGGLGFAVQMDNWMEVSLSREDYQDSTGSSLFGVGSGVVWSHTTMRGRRLWS